MSGDMHGQVSNTVPSMLQRMEPYITWEGSKVELPAWQPGTSEAAQLQSSRPQLCLKRSLCMRR